MKSLFIGSIKTCCCLPVTCAPGSLVPGCKLASILSDLTAVNPCTLRCAAKIKNHFFFPLMPLLPVRYRDVPSHFGDSAWQGGEFRAAGSAFELLGFHAGGPSKSFPARARLAPGWPRAGQPVAMGCGG